MNRPRRSLLIVLVACVSLQVPAPARQTVGPILGAEGDHFTINGVPRFLIFVSYFDALRASDGAWTADLNFVQQSGVSGVRILPNWLHYGCPGTLGGNDSLINSNGGLNSTTLARLKQFLSAASARGLVVDVSFTRETIADEPVSFEAYKNAIRNVTSELVNYRNVLFDVQNEWPSKWETAVSLREPQIKELIAAVHERDAQRLVSGSTDQGDSAAGAFAAAPGINFAAHHDERVANWYDLSDDVVSAVRGGLGSQIQPIYLQEPMAYSLFCPGQDDTDGNGGHHKTAMRNARSAGAAAWTFHTRTGFDLSDDSFLDLASSAQETTISELNGAANGVCWGADAVSLSPQSASIPAAGGNGTFSVAVNGTCNVNWGVSTDSPSWLSGAPASATGNGTASYTATANIGPPRTGRLTVRGRTFTVTQAAGTTVAGNFNQDQNSDLVWQHDDGRIAAWLMNLTGRTSGVLFNPSSVPVQWKIVGTGDANRDGHTDLFFQDVDSASTTVSIWYMNGINQQSGTGIQGAPANVSSDWKVRAVSDLNNDGYPDLIWQNAETGALSYWRLQGNLLIDADSLSPAHVLDTQWHIVGAGHVLRLGVNDGKTDLFWHNRQTGHLSVWYMDGTTMLQGVAITPSPVDPLWQVRGVGDYNRDGKPDLLWQHTNGDIATWLMNGIAQTSGKAFTPSNAGVGWSLVGPR